MAVVLTEKEINRMTTAGDRSDAGQAGLVIRVSPGGAVKSWSFVYRYRGRRARAPLGRYPSVSLDAARIAARAKQKALDDGLDPGAERAARSTALTKGQTLVELVARFDAGPGKKLKSWPEMKRAIEAGAIGVLPELVRDIKRADVRALHEAKSKSAPVQADRLVAYLSTVFNYAIDRLDDEHWLEANPAARIEKNGSTERDRVLSETELGIIATVLGAAVEARTASGKIERAAMVQRVMLEAFLALVLSGQRLQEVLGMRWAELDLARARWTIPGKRTKNKQPHLVPLAPRLQLLLTRIRARRPDVIPAHTPYVFSTTDGLTSVGARGKKYVSAKLLPALVEAFGADVIGEFTAHDVRRTMATGLGSLGVDERIISRVLNHVSTGSRASVTARHYNLFGYEAEKREALAAWERFVIEAARAVPARGVWASAAGVSYELEAPAGRAPRAPRALEAPVLEAELVA